MLGPALLCYNDSAFRPRDWEAIQTVGLGSKEQVAAAIGRYGVGFNATYHYSDTPGILSGARLAFFDPTLRAVHRATEQRPGCLLELRDGNLARVCPNLLPPFCAALFAPRAQSDAEFPGTVMRFPLRLRAASELAPACSVEGVLAALTALAAEAPHTLLFLRHVRRVQADVVDTEGCVKELLAAELASKVTSARSCNAAACVPIPKLASVACLLRSQWLPPVPPRTCAWTSGACA